MAVIGESMGLTIPAVGTSGTAYASQINTALETIQTTLAQLVTPASFNINTYIDMGTNSIRNATYLNLPNYTGTSSSNTNTLYSVSGELYYRDGTGAAVQVTDGGTLSITAASGIGGDYPTDTDASFKYKTSETNYYAFSSVASEVLAGLVLGDVRIVSKSATGVGYGLTATYVGISKTTGGTSYTLTLPNAAPGSTSLWQVTSGGTVSYSNTVSAAVTLSATLTCAAISSSSTITSTNTVKGDKLYHSGTTRLQLPASCATFLGTAALGTSGSIPKATPGTSAGNSVVFGLPMRDDETITKIAFFAIPGTSCTVSYRLVSTQIVTGTPTDTIGATQTEAMTAPTGELEEYTVTVGPWNSTSSVHTYYSLQIWSSQSDTNIYGITITYRRDGT